MDQKEIGALHTRIMARLSKLAPEHPKDSDDAEMVRVMSDSSMLLLDFLQRQARMEQALVAVVQLLALSVRERDNRERAADILEILSKILTNETRDS